VREDLQAAGERRERGGRSQRLVRELENTWTHRFWPWVSRDSAGQGELSHFSFAGWQEEISSGRFAELEKLLSAAKES